MHIAVATLVLPLAQAELTADQRDTTMFLPHMCTLMLDDKAAGAKIIQCWANTAEGNLGGDLDISADGISIDELGRLCEVAGGKTSKDGNVLLVVTGRDGTKTERGCEVRIPPLSRFRILLPGQGG